MLLRKNKQLPIVTAFHETMSRRSGGEKMAMLFGN
jgi:hypothetical protein